MSWPRAGSAVGWVEERNPAITLPTWEKLGLPTQPTALKFLLSIIMRGNVNVVGLGSDGMRIGNLTIQYRSSRGDITANPFKFGYLSFRCNICGQACVAKAAELDREAVSCDGCLSTVRWRSIIHILSVELFGKSLALPDFPERPDIVGMGMSDWNGYATILARKFNYTNTHYHKEPRLDVTAINPKLEGTFDFIISSDVFEHVPPPVSTAFENVRKLLKPEGVLIFTAPFSKDKKTLEHFPELYDYQIVKTDGRYILKNTTKDGIPQVFENLVFHGGPGSTLEMRVFSESSLLEEFRKAGLGTIKIYQAPNFDHGIYWSHEWSLPMSVRVSSVPASEPIKTMSQ